MQDESKPMTTEETLPKDKELQQMQEGTTKALQTEKHRKTFWKYLALIVAALCLYETKSRIIWLPVSDSPQICVVLSDWWGLKVQTVYPVWRKPTGQTEEYSEKWCIRYPDNTWRVFYNTDGKSPAYTYALTNYATYF